MNLKRGDQNSVLENLRIRKKTAIKSITVLVRTGNFVYNRTTFHNCLNTWQYNSLFKTLGATHLLKTEILYLKRTLLIANQIMLELNEPHAFTDAVKINLPGQNCGCLVSKVAMFSVRC
jgi:hypothetical protein